MRHFGWKRCLTLCLAAVIFVLGSSASLSQAAVPQPQITAQSAILIDGLTGRVIWEKDADVHHYPASMTKMMTCLLGLHMIPSDRPITISPNAAATEALPLGIVRGDVLTAGELIPGMMLVSDNGAAVAIAESASGNVNDFVTLMNMRAAKLGMTETHFANPNGLQDPMHYSTARDMAKLARFGMRDPLFRHVVGQPQGVVHWLTPAGKTLAAKNTNELWGVYPGLTGIKTGYTQAAGGCLAASAKRDGLELIAVVMASPTYDSRFGDAAALLDYGFATVTPIEASEDIQRQKTVWVSGGTQARTTVRPQQNVVYPLREGEDTTHYTVKRELPAVLPAPIEDGAVVGRLVLYYDGISVGDVPLVADGVDAGTSIASWLVGVFSGFLTWWEGEA